MNLKDILIMLTVGVLIFNSFNTMYESYAEDTTFGDSLINQTAIENISGTLESFNSESKEFSFSSAAGIIETLVGGVWNLLSGSIVQVTDMFEQFINIIDLILEQLNIGAEIIPALRTAILGIMTLIAVFSLIQFASGRSLGE